MSKSLKALFGNLLKENDYKMSTVNHYKKKYKNFYFCIDRDIADHLLLRLLVKNEFGETKCIRDEFIKNLSLLEKDELIKIVLEKEEIYFHLINN